MSQAVAEHRGRGPEVVEPGGPDRLGHADARDRHVGGLDRRPGRGRRPSGRSSGRSSPTSPTRCARCSQGFAGRDDLHATLVTGGTGISPRDQTYETVSALLTKPLPGYGELFRMLSYAEIGPACLLSRAVGGLMGGWSSSSCPAPAPRSNWP